MPQIVLRKYSIHSFFQGFQYLNYFHVSDIKEESLVIHPVPGAIETGGEQCWEQHQGLVPLVTIRLDL